MKLYQKFISRPETCEILWKVVLWTCPDLSSGCPSIQDLSKGCPGLHDLSWTCLVAVQECRTCPVAVQEDKSFLKNNNSWFQKIIHIFPENALFLFPEDNPPPIFQKSYPFTYLRKLIIALSRILHSFFLWPNENPLVPYWAQLVHWSGDFF